MARAMSVEQPAQAAERLALPYPPSWVDRLTEWVRRLPGPSWLYYLGAWVALLALEMAVKFYDGTYGPGAMIPVPFHVVVTLNAVYVIALMHYLDDVATDAIRTFRPAMTVSDAEYESLRYQLTTLPARPTLVSSIISVVWITIFLTLFADQGMFTAAKFFTSPVSNVLDYLIMVIIWWSNGALLYYIIHKLGLVSRIYTTATRINLFRLGPLYVFSGLTARVAAGWILITYAFIASVPGLLNNMVVIGVVALITLLAVGSFIWPLLGVHRLLEDEKRRLLDLTGQQMEATMLETHDHLQAHELEHLSAQKGAMDYLMTEKEMITKLPTWPWQPGTLGGLSAALVLPILLWLTQRVLENFVPGGR